MATQNHPNGNGFHGKSYNELLAIYNENRRPGRPTPEQRQLKALLEQMEATVVPAKPEIEVVDLGIGPGPKSAKRGKVKVAKEAITEVINVPSIAIGVVPATVLGNSDLIMHAWDVKSKRQIEDKQQKKASRGQREARDPEAEYLAARYVDSKGLECIPARHFKNAMVGAATFLPDVTQKLIKGAVYVQGDLLPILSARTGKPLKSQRRDDMVRIGGMSKTADVRYRPAYVDWKVDLKIEFDSSVFSVEQVINLLNRAGFNVGVGEWRPTYGRFHVAR